MEGQGVAEERGGGGSSRQVIPEAAMDALRRTSRNIDELHANMDQFLSACDADTLSRLSPLERAHCLLLLSKAATTVYALRLRCKGVNPDEHPVKSEIERLSLYQEKLQRSVDLSKAPLRPSATINAQAATRFIEHSLPDLTSEQKQSMREISKGEGTRMKYLERVVHKKRKYQSTDKQSVQSAAQEFLEKASRELLGDNKNGFKGPLRRPEDSDEDIPIA
ncbi:PREDICTED: nuclear nucleic acid-binding protein C1D [Ipomoea nil]|uniref:nuclear nucleic acid-binding protein C1D n=1 Tax=Ipomoea nil TaxID=35883 RepID=UPI0009008932|nr:PREDICTED: nuclear nucleic acid-binding protein C1D [Ipomoea nil]XP_019167753.1 PREDICTED: nuclear nucleic acid-binding protein C1D [Ipomoea nil]